MLDWNTMKMSIKEFNGEPGVYLFRIGNDIAKARVNLKTAEYFEEINFQMISHYIGYPERKPSNPNRTIAFQSHIYSRIKEIYLEEIEEMFGEIANLPKAEDNKLQNDYEGKRATFYKGTEAKEIFRWLNRHYSSTCAAGNFYQLVQKYENTEGFLADEIEDYLFL